MKLLTKKIIYNLRSLIDIFGIPFFFISAILMKIYKLIGIKNLKYSTKLIKYIGIFPIRHHYYEPSFNHNVLRSKFDKINKNLNVFDEKKFDINYFKKFKFSKELLNLNLNQRKNSSSFFIDNPFFSRGDADFLYQFVRLTKPKNIIEIGSGYSTLIINKGILKNKEEKNNCKIISIDPGKIDLLDNMKIKRIRKKIEDCNLSIFKKLKKNDLLLIDSSHIIKPFGDVLKIYQEIIPLLNKGVNICVHDIFIPYSYPSNWIIDQNLFWNEQYILEIILMNKNKYKIIAPLFFMKKKYFQKMKLFCPYLNNEAKPSSLYFKILK